MKNKKVLKLLAITILIIVSILFMIDVNNYSKFIVSDNTEDIKYTKEKEEVILIDTKEENTNNRFSLTNGMYSLTNNQMEHSKENIKNKYINSKVSVDENSMFEIDPVFEDFNQDAGKLSSLAMNDTLNVINYYRYLAGIDSVSVLDRAVNYNMKGAVLLSQSNFSHTPEKSDNMTEKFYLDALCGTSLTVTEEYNELVRKSGLWNSYSVCVTAGDEVNLTDAIKVWTDDSGKITHRLSILNPFTKNVSFGYTNNPNSDYIRYSTYSGFELLNKSIINKYYTWPAAGDCPIESVSGSKDTVWSITFVNTNYNFNKDNIKIFVDYKGNSFEISDIYEHENNEMYKRYGFEKSTFYYKMNEEVLDEITLGNRFKEDEEVIINIYDNGGNNIVSFPVRFFSVEKYNGTDDENVSDNEEQYLPINYYLTEPKVQYASFIEKNGWQYYVINGDTSGTVGKGLKIEGLKMKLKSNISGSIEYSSHVQNVGWTDFVKDNEVSGRPGSNLRLEGIKIRLTGTISSIYDIYYRVHVQNIGWLGWAKNGEEAGTEGYGFRIEGIEIKLIEKGSSVVGSIDNHYMINRNVFYTTHVQNVGWQKYVSGGKNSGTEGKGYRLEGIKIKLLNIDGGIKYSTHIQNIGWSDFSYDDNMSGTEGMGLRLEAIKIELTGNAKEEYDILYRVHVQNVGWLGWAKNGEEAGTEGMGLRLEGIQIKLVSKDSNYDNSISCFVKE